MSPYPTYHPTMTNPPTYNPTTSQSPTYGRKLFVCCSSVLSYQNYCVCLFVCLFVGSLLIHHINLLLFLYNSDHNVSTNVGLSRHTQTDQ